MPSEGLRLLRSMTLFLHRDEVANLVDHAARLGRVRQLHRVVEASESKADHRLVLRPIESNRALHERDLEALAVGVLCLLRGHRTFDLCPLTLLGPNQFRFFLAAE